MKKNNKENLLIVIIIFTGLILGLLYYRTMNNNVLSKSNKNMTSHDISKLTDKWIYNVTIKNDADAVRQMFCDDGNLVATASKTIRQGRSILEYFKWFTNLPNIKVINKEYSITSITPEVYLNNAWVTWVWDGLDEPLVARMSFTFRKNCIYQLHSSVLPEKPDELNNNYALI